MKNRICENCNNPIEENAKFCNNCGNKINNNNSLNIINNENTNKSKNNYSLIGLICGACSYITCGLTSIFGLIFSIIGLSKSKEKGEKDAIAIGGLVLSIIPYIIFIIAIAFTIITAKDVEVIDFSSKNKEEAKEWCDKNNITCYISDKYSDTISEGKLIEQDKKPGEIIKSYETIDLDYSKGKKEKKNSSTSPTPSPNPTPSPSPSQETKIKEKFSLIESYVSGESNEFAMYIEGKIKNNRDRNI